jgi:hypothetical protein
VSRIAAVKRKLTELREPSEQPKALAVWAAPVDGSCQGCATNHRVIKITANSWITRLCVECLYDAVKLL